MKKVLAWLLLLVGFVPIAYSNTVLFPLLSIKTLFIRGLIFAAFAAFTWLLSTDSSYRSEMWSKTKALARTAIARTALASFVVLGVSTCFAFDRHTAFVGTVERGEGFVGLAVFFCFFALVALVFEKKDWQRFFQVTVLSGLVLFIGEIVQLCEGVSRPGSLVDNPIFLAVYLLFVIFAAFRMYQEGTAKGGDSWKKTAGIASICISVAGVFISQSRGVMAGMGLGLVVALAYYAIQKRKQGAAGKKTARKFLSGIGILVALGIIFAVTRHSPVWQHVPGLNRAAQFTTSDATTRARLINFHIALDSVSPKHEPAERLVIGWGWDNYVYAWQKYYIPTIYQYDMGLFDRAHDKLLDMLVMNGVLGLLAYLALWCMFFRAVYMIGKKNPALAAAAIFWGVAFFVQNLSSFDSVVTYLSFYGMLAYITYEKRS